MKTFFFYLHLLKMSIRTCLNKREVFLIELVSMILNNLIFFSIWIIFFRQFNDISGWNMGDMTVLTAVGIGSYGLMQVLFGGIKPLSRMIMNGDLDPYMTQPKNLLIHIIGSKSTGKGWGHLSTALIVMMFGGLMTVQTLPLLLLGMISGALVFAAAGIVSHSLPFWFGSVESLSKKYCDSLFLFALYPTNIYSGLLQLVMFTLMPAGIIGYLPVELVREFTWMKLGTLLISSAGFFVLAFYIFFAGLRRYESGNRFGMRIN